MIIRAMLSLIAATLLTASAFAAPVVIDFEGDSVGSKPNGFSAVGFPGVTFSDTLGADLQVYTGLSAECGNASNKCLVVFSDDTGGLLMNFDSTVSSLSLDFGNDNPGFVFAGDLGLLTVFLNGQQVGQAGTLLNIDDIMNQSVSIAGLLFDSATFFFTDAQGAPRGLIEVVDNITYESAAVPEPSSLLLAALGLLGLGASRRRNK